jgi:hypothetical protein
MNDTHLITIFKFNGMTTGRSSIVGDHMTRMELFISIRSLRGLFKTDSKNLELKKRCREDQWPEKIHWTVFKTVVHFICIPPRAKLVPLNPRYQPSQHTHQRFLILNLCATFDIVLFLTYTLSLHLEFGSSIYISSFASSTHFLFLNPGPRIYPPDSPHSQ